jgi:hypothetical protein
MLILNFAYHLRCRRVPPVETTELLVSAGDGDNIHTIKKNTEIMLEATWEVCLGGNRERTVYMVMSLHQTVRQNVVKFSNLGTTVTNQIFIQEEIKSRLSLGNACCLLISSVKT